MLFFISVAHEMKVQHFINLFIDCTAVTHSHITNSKILSVIHSSDTTQSQLLNLVTLLTYSLTHALSHSLTNEFHGGVLLVKLTILNQSRNSLHLREIKVSLPCSTCPCPGSDESDPCFQLTSLLRSILILSPSDAYIFQVVLFLEVSPPRPPLCHTLLLST